MQNLNRSLLLFASNLDLLRANPARFARNFAMLMVGLVLFALAMVFSLQCNLGASSWAVFHDGIAIQTPLSFGQGTILVGVIMVFVSWAFRVKPGAGTFANMILVGIWVDVILWSDIIPEAQSYPARIAMLLVAVFLLGFATAMYIKPGFGAGPRDSFMLAMTRLTNIRVSIIRWGMEVSVVILGILMGGDFGIGTIIFAMLIGPVVGFWFGVFKIQTRRVKIAPSTSTAD
jgi:uncharacterized protein